MYKEEELDWLLFNLTPPPPILHEMIVNSELYPYNAIKNKWKCISVAHWKPI